MSKREQNNKKFDIEYFSDFSTNLDKNPITGFLARNINENAVKTSIRNILLTRVFERPYSFAGSKLYHLLFEPMDEVTDDILRDTIKNTITNYEPRAKVAGIDIQPDASLNQYDVTIHYTLINIPSKTFSTNVTLKRVR